MNDRTDLALYLRKSRDKTIAWNILLHLILTPDISVLCSFSSVTSMKNKATATSTIHETLK